MKDEPSLTPEERKATREKVYPFSENTPLTDTEELIDKVQIETLRTQLAKVLEHRLDRPRIICLCGSTRFIKEFQEHYGRLTDEGYIVLTVGRVVPQHEQHLERKRKLDELHLRKIDLADEVFVININGYIGESTSREIDYATKLGKPIKYLEPQQALKGGEWLS